MQIGQLARQLGVTRETLRFYESEGLLKPESRTESGYRVFGTDAIHRLQFIQNARRVGFSLKDIKYLLEISDGMNLNCDEIREFAVGRLKRLRSHIKDLKSMERTLTLLVKRCKENSAPESCPIIAEFISEK